jgi:hypothetical protein
MQILLQSASLSPTSAIQAVTSVARVLKFDCRNNQPAAMAPFSTTALTTATAAKPTIASGERPRDPFPAGVLCSAPATPASVAAVSDCPRISSVVQGQQDVEAGTSNKPKPPAVAPPMAEPASGLPSSLATSSPMVGWSMPRSAVGTVSCKTEATDAAAASAAASCSNLVPAAQVMIAKTPLSDCPAAVVSVNGAFLPVPQSDCHSGAFAAVGSPVALSNATISRPPSASQQHGPDVTSSPVAAAKPHSRASTEQTSKTSAASSAAGSPATAPAHLEDVRVADLKAECRKRCLAVSGPKPNLIARLRPYADDILRRLSIAAGSSPVDDATERKHAGRERSMMADASEQRRPGDVDERPTELALGVPPPVSGAVPDTSFHPLLECASSPSAARGRPGSAASGSLLQSPIKALFSPSRPLNGVSTSVPYAASSASAVSLLFASPSSSATSPAPSSSGDRDNVPPLVRRLFETTSMFQPSASAAASPPSATGSMLSNAFIHLPAVDVGSSSMSAVATGLGFQAATSAACASLAALQVPDMPPQSASSSASCHGFPFDDSRGTGFLQVNASPFDVATQAMDSMCQASGADGISFNLPPAFHSPTGDMAELDSMDDDVALQRAFDAMSAEFLVDDVAGVVAAGGSLGGYPPVAAETAAASLTSSALTSLSSAAPDAAMMSPEELLDLQRRQIRELQALLEQSRMELLETQVSDADSVPSSHFRRPVLRCSSLNFVHAEDWYRLPAVSQLLLHLPATPLLKQKARLAPVKLLNGGC